jgi:quercetin dioxygenase-like cupin family protein
MSTSHPKSSESLPDSLVETLAHALVPRELGAQQRERLRSRVLKQSRDSVPQGTSTLRTDAKSWITVAPFIQMKVLRRDEAAGNQTVLIRMQPGGVIPAHRHSQEEEFLVLEGECHVGAHRLCAGDVHVASAGSRHEEVTTRTGVLALLRGEYPAPCDRVAGL